MDSQLIQAIIKKSNKIGFPDAFALVIASSRLLSHKMTGGLSFIFVENAVVIGIINKARFNKIFSNMGIFLDKIDQCTVRNFL